MASITIKKQHKMHKNKKKSSWNGDGLTQCDPSTEVAEESAEEFDVKAMIREQNKKKKAGGGFQRMGLSSAVLRGVLRKGYKIPTPIQRKSIPIILEGKDVVAMARTGSGKTAAFLIPLFEQLKVHCAKSGARALILSPTRELALQTLKFTKELGRFTGLRAAVVLGGDKIEDQFSAIHENPDVIIATPGRFLHVLVEMDLKLSSIEYVVFDEADRLFEMGFQEQLHEILNRLPENRQTLLFSATLPRLLADFAKAGLSDPELIRLDVDSKLSENLKTAYFCCRSDDKSAVLLHLLTNVIKPDELTVVFLATRHHVDHICELLRKAGIAFSYVYSTLDQTARKIEIAKFQTRKSRVLLVTDVAARGIDIPLLDNVINFNFPAKPKLFVHRVGRVARAGRSGTAYSIVSPDETAYMLDLHLFLGRPLKPAQADTSDTDGMIGTVPQRVIDEESDLITTWYESSADLRSMAKISSNAYKQYTKSRPSPSCESVRRIKLFSASSLKIHPIFIGVDDNITLEEKRNRILLGMKSYRPNSTTFEIGATAKSQASVVMRAKKKYHENKIAKARLMKESATSVNIQEDLQMTKDDDNDDEMQEVTFRTLEQKSGVLQEHSQTKRKAFQDGDYYLSYRSSDHHQEKGLELERSFNRRIASEVLDMTGDDSMQIRQTRNVAVWDKKKKKFAGHPGVDHKCKKIKTESGAWIPASYKSNIYKQWKERNKVEQRQRDEEEMDDNTQQNRQLGKFRPGRRRWNGKGRSQMKGVGGKRELKTKEEILKSRQRREKIQFHQKRRQLAKKKNRKRNSK